MKKKKNKGQETPARQVVDPRLQTAPGHYLKNAPWRQEVVLATSEQPDARMISARDTVVLAFLVISSVVVAAALWMNPPQRLRFNEEAVRPKATMAVNRVPRPYNGLGYDPTKFEEVKEDDPIVQDDLEDVLLEVPAEDAEKPNTL